MLVGAALALAASPAAAERIGLDSFHFARQHLLFLPVALIVMLGVSLLSRTGVKRIGTAGTVLSIALLALTLIIGAELNGARRWLPLGGFHLQPSEFVKPCLAVFMAAVLARSKEEQLPYGKLFASVPVILAALLLVLQPDIGMATTVAAVWFVQMFVAGMPLALAVVGGAATAGGLFFAYHHLTHVKNRIDQFIDPTTGDTYQVDTSLRAFEAGGLFGRGPGEGTVKNALPDAHTDFIFAVAAEEFGVIACIVIIGTPEPERTRAVARGLAVLGLVRAVVQAARVLRRIRPAAAVGFGGYPSVPPLVASGRLGIPSVLHEQNAVLGRANRMLARRASAIATSFPETERIPHNRAGLVTHVGNPVRAAIAALRGTQYDPPAPDGPFRLLVTGGSQGARVSPKSYRRRWRRCRSLSGGGSR
ncbi:Probable peptidoglycan glycosyltransferase FtsW [Geodia barretti]|uniref:peptidoglycan glycosyltransferase n=1 Tax=Geodia barretti TaxID=519541 RepID=A0AA35TTD2_GEOBA|nr:Probable peptidoglycan glycosyltransferase FtsW [Geodia barretti]